MESEMAQQETQYFLAPGMLQEAAEAAQKVMDTLPMEDLLIDFTALMAVQMAFLEKSQFPEEGLKDYYRKIHGVESPMNTWEEFAEGSHAMFEHIAEGLQLPWSNNSEGINKSDYSAWSEEDTMQHESPQFSLAPELKKAVEDITSNIVSAMTLRYPLLTFTALKTAFPVFMLHFVDYLERGIDESEDKLNDIYVLRQSWEGYSERSSAMIEEIADRLHI